MTLSCFFIYWIASRDKIAFTRTDLERFSWNLVLWSPPSVGWGDSPVFLPMKSDFGSYFYSPFSFRKSCGRGATQSPRPTIYWVSHCFAISLRNSPSPPLIATISTDTGYHGGMLTPVQSYRFSQADSPHLTSPSITTNNFTFIERPIVIHLLKIFCWVVLLKVSYNLSFNLDVYFT